MKPTFSRHLTMDNPSEDLVILLGSFRCVPYLEDQGAVSDAILKR